MNPTNSLEIDVPRVCERFATARPGMRLVDGVMIGLPTYDLTLSLLVQDERPIPPVHEYAMRAIGAALGDPAQVEGFLGLSRPTVRRVIADLMHQDELHLAATAMKGHQFLAVTPKGSRTLEQASLLIPQEVVVPVRYDGLSRSLLEPSNEPLHWPRELRERGIADIPPSPARPPEAREISVAGLDAYVCRLRRGKSKTRMVLAVKDVIRSVRQYRLGVALVFVRDGTQEIQVHFVFDGRLRDDYSQAFARSKAIRKLGFVKQLQANLRDAALDSERMSSSLPPVDEEAEERGRAAIAEAIAQQDAPAEGVAVPTSGGQQEGDKVALAKANLNGLTIRNLRTYEHPQLLDRALSEATERLLIISPWISAQVVDRRFIRRLWSLLLRGCHVAIGWGLGPESEDKCLNNHKTRALISDLTKIGEQHKNFLFTRLGDTHAKVLVVDRSFYVNTSFNWLSFRGDPDRTFRDEQGTYVTRPLNIDEVYDFNITRIRRAIDGRPHS